MSEFVSLRINRTEPELEGSPGDWLRIEQPEWKDPPSGGFLAWVVASGRGLSIATYAEYASEYYSHCEKDGELTVEIQIHRSRPDLPYSISTSYGELSEKYIHHANFKRSQTVSMAKSLDLKAQIVGQVSAVWEGAVFDLNGMTVSPPPPISVSGSVLSWGEDVSGVLRLSYTEEHDAYTLAITPREPGEYEVGSLENAYESTVFAVWAGGAETHDVDLPDMDGYCGGGSRTFIDQDDPDKEKCVRHNILVDACTLEVIREWDDQIACPEDS